MMSGMISRLISRTQEEKNNILNASFDSNDSFTASLSSSFDGNKKHRKIGSNKKISNMSVNTSHYDDL